MTSQWKIGDLAKVKLYKFKEDRLVVGVTDLFFHQRYMCRVSVMDPSFGSDELTLPVSSLECING